MHKIRTQNNVGIHINMQKEQSRASSKASAPMKATMHIHEQMVITPNSTIKTLSESPQLENHVQVFLKNQMSQLNKKNTFSKTYLQSYKEHKDINDAIKQAEIASTQPNTVNASVKTFEPGELKKSILNQGFERVYPVNLNEDRSRLKTQGGGRRGSTMTMDVEKPKTQQGKRGSTIQFDKTSAGYASQNSTIQEGEIEYF